MYLCGLLANLMRAVSVVDVEKVVPFVATRVSPLDMAVYSVHEC